MEDQEQYDPLQYNTGNTTTNEFQLLEDQFEQHDLFQNSSLPQSNPRLHITEPQYIPKSDYSNQMNAGYRATPEHSPSPASSAGENEQQNYTGSVGLSYQHSPMMGNLPAPAGFSEGLASLNFGNQLSGGMRSPPEGYPFQQGRVPTPLSSAAASDPPSPQHPSAGASSPGTPAMQRPMIVTDSYGSLNSTPRCFVVL